MKEEKENRFSYSDDSGLELISKVDVKKSEDNQLEGGKSDNLTIEDLAKKHKVDLNKIKDQVKQGVKVEMEHTNNPRIALEIVLDHLFESASYYTKLKEMEKTFKKDE